MSVLTVIPCLNEATHLEPLIGYLLSESESCPMRIVVADGGSTDGTVAILERLAAAHPTLTYLRNPKRIQSAAINLAVANYADDATFLIRIDAHADYPPGFCVALVEEANQTQADSVVVTMRTVSRGGFQDAVAAAQNSVLGNGGSAHRTSPGEGKWVDHGHHALMRIAAYRVVGGYDERFSHNEDAELDARLAKTGHRIWLTARKQIDYYPRSSVPALFRQYRNYGTGRAQTLLTHRIRPKLRQMLPVAVAPALLLALFTPIHEAFALPAVAWAGVCLVYGILIALRAQRLLLAISGVVAMIMHSAWSLGFFIGIKKFNNGQRA